SVFSIPSHSRSPRITKLIRNIKKIDTTAFSNDIFSSSLYTAQLSSLNAYILQFSSTLSLLLDKHATLKTITCPSQQRKPFITDDILKEKAKRSKLETIYRRNKTPANKANFKNQARFLNKLITASRRSYFRNLISAVRLNLRNFGLLLNLCFLANHHPVSLHSLILPNLRHLFLTSLVTKLLGFVSLLIKPQ